MDDQGRDDEAGEAICDENGVDLTLVDAMLAMSVEERLRLNDRMARSVRLLQGAFAGDEDREDARR